MDTYFLDFSLADITATFQTYISEIYIVLLISVPLSLLLFLLFNKLQHKMLVNLGDHRWLIKK